MTTRRLEAFSDGVFAIAATLLILNVAVTGVKPLDRELIDIWPSYVAYAIAFLTIGVVWANHHTVIDQCKQVNRLFLMLNVIWLYASGGGRLLRHDADARVVEGITRSYLPGPLIYLAATLLALVNPILSAAIFALVPVFYVVESSFFGTGG